MKQNIQTNSMEWEATKIKGFLSKQLIDANNGSLKLIKVESSSVYPMHNHPEKVEFIYVLEGSPEIIIGEDRHYGQPADFFILPQRMNHSIINNGSLDCILLVGAIKN